MFNPRIITALFNDFSHTLFPALCLMCEFNQKIKEDILCLRCKSELPFTDHFILKENKASDHFRGRIPLANAAALLNFYQGSPLQNLLYNLKYKNQPQIGVELGKMIGNRLQKVTWSDEIDISIPIPIHSKKLLRRKYNQSEKIAQGIANTSNIKTNNKVLIKNKNTPSQTHLSRQERIDNVIGSFTITQPKLIENKHVLLVDDVLTTGATIEIASKKLIEGGVSQISLVTAAIAAN